MGRLKNGAAAMVLVLGGLTLAGCSSMERSIGDAQAAADRAQAAADQAQAAANNAANQAQAANAATQRLQTTADQANQKATLVESRFDQYIAEENAAAERRRGRRMAGGERG